MRPGTLNIIKVVVLALLVVTACSANAIPMGPMPLPPAFIPMGPMPLPPAFIPMGPMPLPPAFIPMGPMPLPPAAA